MLTVDPLSVVPLHIECVYGEKSLGIATGFYVKHASKSYLVTNWHVVTGLNSETNQPHRDDGSTPDAIPVWHHGAGGLGHWARLRVPLYDQKGAAWKEHPSGRSVDVVALPMPDNSAVVAYPLDLALADTDILISPSEPVSIIGFPLGLASNAMFPVWKTGHVASDIDLDYKGKPAFLIDAMTVGGMSGSPVVARRTSGYRSTSATLTLNTEFANRFMGVYSGRIHRESGIGMVWKPHTLDAILGRTSPPRASTSTPGAH